MITTQKMAMRMKVTTATWRVKTKETWDMEPALEEASPP